MSKKHKQAIHKTSQRAQKNPQTNAEMFNHPQVIQVQIKTTLREKALSTHWHRIKMLIMRIWGNGNFHLFSVSENERDSEEQYRIKI